MLRVCSPLRQFKYLAEEIKPCPVDVRQALKEKRRDVGKIGREVRHARDQGFRLTAKDAVVDRPIIAARFLFLYIHGSYPAGVPDDPHPAAPAICLFKIRAGISLPHRVPR